MAYRSLKYMGISSVSWCGASHHSMRPRHIWYAEHEGGYLFSDLADPLGSEAGTNVHGLFGAIIIEAAGSTWFDLVTGGELKSGMFADIYHPVKPAFREYAVFFHDELELLNGQNLPPTDPHTGLPSSTTAISYRAEPMRNRLPLGHHHAPADTDEDISMSSWAYSDPAPAPLKAYVGGPVKIRLLHAGVMETHVFHLHNHQWRLEPQDRSSTIINSISIGPPGELYPGSFVRCGQPYQHDWGRHFPLPSLPSFP